MLLSSPMSATPKRSGDLDGRYVPQAFDLAMGYQSQVMAWPFPRPLRVGLVKNQRGLALALLKENEAGSACILDLSSEVLEPSDSIESSMLKIQNAVLSFPVLNPPRLSQIGQ